MTDTALHKVSVVVPNYNHATFLPQRLDTIYAQTFGDFELILLDDASTDDSCEILRSYATRPNTRLVVNERNSGSVFAQWNKGVRMARGELVWIAESDDYAAPRLLEVLESCLRQHPEVDLAYCQSWIVDEAGTVIKKNDQWTDDLPNARRWRRDHVADGRHECARYLVRKCTIPNASAVLFRKAAYVQAGYADGNFRLAGDWLMWARMLMPSRLAFVAEPLNFFRQHSQTQRSRVAYSIKWLEQFRIVAWIDSHCLVNKRVREKILDELADFMTTDVIGELLKDAEQEGDQNAAAAARYMLMRKHEWQGDYSLRAGYDQQAVDHYRSALRCSPRILRVQIKQTLLQAGILPHLVRKRASHGMGVDNV